MELLPPDLVNFVTESNRIEGIHRKPTVAELRAHCVFLAADYVTISDLEALVRTVAPGKPLRDQPGMNVRVGNHVAPPGGPNVTAALHFVLDEANGFVDPHAVHLRYETLHPFMDGNGRSGRALWLWQMLNQHDARHAIRMGFLHLFYYQTLAAIPKRQAEGSPEAATRLGYAPRGHND
jgi:hypothetical protein